jgi:MFS family permease
MAALRITSPFWLTLLMCVGEVLMMLGIAVYPGLLPEFQQLWDLTNGEAGWVSGIFYAGYVVTVPPLVALTDVHDPRRIYLVSGLVTVLACIGFALFAEGFWSAMACRFLGGIGLAGTYMVGLRILTDRTKGRAQSRAIAFYTANYAIGQAVGIWLVGLLARHFDWQVSAYVSAGAAFATVALVALVVAPDRARRSGSGWRHAIDLRPAFKNRKALGFTLAYACHGWELFAFRSFAVSFVAFTLADGARTLPFGLAPSDAAALVFFLGLPASVLGNELAHRYGRERMTFWIMWSSALVGLAVPLLALSSFWLLIPALLLYGMTLTGDSSLLTGGAFANALPGRQGATMAVHSIMGFAIAIPAPIVFGYLLDHGGGEKDQGAWILAFCSVSLGAALGPVLLRLLAGRPAAVASSG